MLSQVIWIILPIIMMAFQQVLTQTNTEVSQLERFYYDKCLKNTGRGEVFETLRNDAYELHKYFEYTFQFLPSERKHFCDTERPNLKHRIKKIESDLKSCLNDQEKFLASFIRRSFDEFLHFFCHNNGEYTRNFFSSEGSQCRKVIEESKSNDLDNCLSRIFAPSKNDITQAEICDDITVTRKCFAQLLDGQCPKSYNFKKLNDVFFDYIAAPCSSCVTVFNNCILIGVVLLNLLIYR